MKLKKLLDETPLTSKFRHSLHGQAGLMKLEIMYQLQKYKQMEIISNTEQGITNTEITKKISGIIAIN